MAPLALLDQREQMEYLVVTEQQVQLDQLVMMALLGQLAFKEQLV
jgi:hypothetical protein